MNETLKSTLVGYLLTAPLLFVVIIAPFLRQYVLKLTYYNVPATNLVMTLILVVGGIGCGVMYMLVTFLAQNAVAGKRFLVGHVYDRKGQAREIRLQLGEYSLISRVEGGWYMYVVWRNKNNRKVADYVLLTQKKMEDVLAASSEWEISAAGWFAKAQVYPVTLLEAYSAVIDVMRELANVSGSVPVYYLRDAPGLVISKERERETIE